MRHCIRIWQRQRALSGQLTHTCPMASACSLISNVPSVDALVIWGWVVCVFMCVCGGWRWWWLGGVTAKIHVTPRSYHRGITPGITTRQATQSATPPKKKTPTTTNKLCTLFLLQQFNEKQHTAPSSKLQTS